MEAESLGYHNSLSANHGPIGTQTNHMKQKVVNNYGTPQQSPLLNPVPPRKTAIFPQSSLKKTEKDLLKVLLWLDMLQGLPPDILAGHLEKYNLCKSELAALKTTCKGWGRLTNRKDADLLSAKVRSLMNNISMTSIQRIEASVSSRLGTNTSSQVHCCKCNAENPQQHCGPWDVSPIPEDSEWSPKPCLHTGGGTESKFLCRKYTPG